MDATELGKLCEKHADTFIVVIRNPDGSVDRIGSAEVVLVRIYDDGRLHTAQDDTEGDESSVYPCLVLERDPE